MNHDPAGGTTDGSDFQELPKRISVAQRLKPGHPHRDFFIRDIRVIRGQNPF